jgi:hypothetical protein
MFRSRIKPLAAVLLLGAMLAACSDIYYDRRETIALSTGDGVMTNRVTHMIDPWPPSSANRNIAYNGERAQAAVERYRHNRVIQPVNATTSSVDYQRAQQAAAGASNSTQASTNTPSSSVRAAIPASP